ncbi:malto-oligosyltrehalose synthase [Actinomyces sp. S4-C9]|uniref:malto-oligosyltrehalose synthase n=1 Tax=Actinomyces sp. S4-C9 TaxID=1219581 RepID=UPI00050DE1D3|nr:malto-oligosyltrehalose synthase [Actinomyces sp. S4-C9]KGF02238.1 maltooligosyl trehalose synthase [Actinomyces sp. S4-C9]
MNNPHPHLPAEGKCTPISTYRLQVNENFPFSAAEEVLPYLVDLGVTDVYLSPILQAAPGSLHGYDVVDHTHISVQLGGLEAFKAFSDRAHELGLHVIVDIVPNHMAVPTPVWHNKAMWSVLKHGAESGYANWFDVDLDSPILMPVLGKRIGQVLADQEIQLEKMVVPTEPQYGEQWVLTYYEHVFPVAKGTESLPLSVLIERQHYRLAHWKVADEELNYRRFFDVGTLAGLRIEQEEVFQATHALILNLVQTGYIDGLRVDHPDGLANPTEYFKRLHEATGGQWIVAEKILEGDEDLPSNWPVAGTTGYDTAWRLHALLTEPAGAMPLGAIMQNIAGDSPSSLPSIIRAAKAQIIDTSLAAEVRRVGTLIWQICQEDIRLRDYTFRSLIDCLRELVIEFDRYRAYVAALEPVSDATRAVVEDAAARARTRLDDDLDDAMDVIVALVLGDEVGSAGLDVSDERRREVMVRFQQICGAVQAKGVEDTAFYRWTHMTSLNEVGSTPEVFSLDIDRFHAFESKLQSNWTATMTCGTTHDTKRGEDVRARISLLSQRSKDWASLLNEMRALSREYRPAHVDGRAENLMWQTIVGTWGATDRITADRLTGYLTKAIREQKEWTSWTSSDERREQEFLKYACAIISDPQIIELLDEWCESNTDLLRSVILPMKALQLTLPGVADVYQGTEITATSLVDPDNRRPVDFPGLAQMLDKVFASSPQNLDEEKMLITASLLRLRRDLPSVFVSKDSGYQALPTSSGHCVAFARTLAGEPRVVTVATRRKAALDEIGGWDEVSVVLPDGSWQDVFTGEVFQGGATPATDLLDTFPVSVLKKIEES